MNRRIIIAAVKVTLAAFGLSQSRLPATSGQPGGDSDQNPPTERLLFDRAEDVAKPPRLMTSPTSRVSHPSSGFFANNRVAQSLDTNGIAISLIFDTYCT
jgi:hypothetical protein